MSDYVRMAGGDFDMEIKDRHPAPKGLPFSGAPDYINYNFKFWETCQYYGHDFVKRPGGDEQCAVCGVLNNDVYKNELVSARYREHYPEGGVPLYGWKGCWEAPTVKPSRTPLLSTGKPLSNSNGRKWYEFWKE